MTCSRETGKTHNLSLEDFPPYQAFYYESMLYIAKSAVAAVEELNEAVKVWNQLQTDEEHDQIEPSSILDPAQAVVTQAGLLSKFFWPPREKKKSVHAKRARFLRQEFSVDDSSPLKSRDLRDRLEHFDEKLDLYLSEGIVGHILPAAVGDLSGERAVPTHIFRGYDPSEAKFEVLGQQFELEPIVEEIDRILQQLLSRSDH